ncbi:MAG: hypothetical protein Q9207_006250 [Kuettlingeria erythrocarpa]
MVAISAVRSSNESLRNLPPHLSSPTAVFTGATQGIGLESLRQLATYTVAPTCYIVGRSEARVQGIIDELKELNVKGTYIFVKGEVALLESVDECCKKIKESLGEKGLDMLYMSQGYIDFGGRNGEHLLRPDRKLQVELCRTDRLTVFACRDERRTGYAVGVTVLFQAKNRPQPPGKSQYLSHPVLISARTTTGTLPSVSCTSPSLTIAHPPLTFSLNNPQPLLSPAPNPRIISVLAAGQEAKINLSDLELKHNYGVIACANHGTTMTSLVFEHLAHQQPTVSFIHVHPGYVKTNILQSGFSWPVAYLFKYIIQPLISFLETPLLDVGDRQVFYGTSARYPPLSSSQATSTGESSTDAGAPLPAGVEIAMGSDGNRGSGAYLTTADSEAAPTGTGKLLRGYREEGVPEKVWRHTEEIFATVRGD